MTNFSLFSIFTPIAASSFLGFPAVEKPRKTFAGDYGSNARKKVGLATASPSLSLWESWDLPCLIQDRGILQGRHSQALGTVHPGPWQFFFHTSSKFLASSLPPPLKSVSEGIQAGIPPAWGRPPGLGAFCQSGAQPLEAGVGLVEAVATGLPMKLSPLLSIPGVGPSAVSDHRAALSPALISPSAHSSPHPP